MKTYTLPEVAVMFCVSVETIRRHVRGGKLKASKVGRQWRIEEDDLKAYFQNHSNQQFTKD